MTVVVCGLWRVSCVRLSRSQKRKNPKRFEFNYVVVVKFSRFPAIVGNWRLEKKKIDSLTPKTDRISVNEPTLYDVCDTTAADNCILPRAAAGRYETLITSENSSCGGTFARLTDNRDGVRLFPFYFFPLSSFFFFFSFSLPARRAHESHSSGNSGDVDGHGGRM